MPKLSKIDPFAAIIFVSECFKTDDGAFNLLKTYSCKQLTWALMSNSAIGLIFVLPPTYSNVMLLLAGFISTSLFSITAVVNAVINGRKAIGNLNSCFCNLLYLSFYSSSPHLDMTFME